MSAPAPPARPALWCGLALFFLAWNGSLALYGGHENMTQAYDGIQYQLLARNRLLGRYEVGGRTHTVGLEGSHPMWRPGLVWLEEGLARVVGSVRTASCLTSALGTTLLELAMLWLARRCFGRAVFLTLLAALVFPGSVSAHFVWLAAGQGAEVWATAAVLWGLAGLIEAQRLRESPRDHFGQAAPASAGPAGAAGSGLAPWALAFGAGVCAGSGDWFRTGNLVLFGGMCGVYLLVFLGRRDGRGVRLVATSLAGFLAMSGVGDRLAPSSGVDKATANLWGSLVEYHGPTYRHEIPNGYRPVVYYLGGLVLAPGLNETYYDHLVRRSGEKSAGEYFREHADQILPLYRQRVTDIVSGGFYALRIYLGGILLVYFFVQVAASLCRPGPGTLPTLALANAGLLFYLGPVALLRGDHPTHYLLVIYPIFVLLGVAGLVQVLALTGAWCLRCFPGLRALNPRLAVVLLAGPFVLLSGIFYRGALMTLQETKAMETREQAALDALALEGRKVACRNMIWFSDRDVETVMLPYATVPELEGYVRYQNADGILLWENEDRKLFEMSPYETLEGFDRALRQSPVFGPPQVSGAWRWYPVRRPEFAGGTP